VLLLLSGVAYARVASAIVAGVATVLANRSAPSTRWSRTSKPPVPRRAADAGTRDQCAY